MNVNGVTETNKTYTDYSKKTDSEKSKSDALSDKTASSVEEGAVYERSDNTAKATAKTYKPNKEMIDKLKADADSHVQQLQDIVNKLLTKQATCYNTANGLKSIYESLEVDEATRAQAQADIAEDGYWGVEQTSSRIFDFAMALSGGDNDNMEKMKNAFLKAYDNAEKIWGGKLPEISQKTYDAVLKKFDDYANGNSDNEE